MLYHEDHIIHHAHVAQRKLDRVPRDAAPVALQVAVDSLLPDAQDAAAEVQQDLPYAPAPRALVAPVDEHLRGVLDERDHHLDVPDRVHDIQLAPVHSGIYLASRCASLGCDGRPDDDARPHDADDAARAHAEDEAARPCAHARGEAPQRAREQVLRCGDEAEDEAVQGKGDVVELDGRGEVPVAGGVLGADDGGVEEGGVGDEVGREACDDIC